MIRLKLFCAIVVILFGCDPTLEPGRSSEIARSGDQLGPKDSLVLLSQHIGALQLQLERLQEKHSDMELFSGDLNRELGTTPLLRQGTAADRIEVLLAEYRYRLGHYAQTADALREQIAEGRQQIAQYQAMLSSAHADIEILDTYLSQLEMEVCMRDAKIDSLVDAMNQVYFVWGSAEELAKNGVVRARRNWRGKLRSIELAEWDNNAYFTPADKRQLREIPIYSDQAEVLSNHPKDSYLLIEDEFRILLRIEHPDKFWQTTDHLAVVVGE